MQYPSYELFKLLLPEIIRAYLEITFCNKGADAPIFSE